MTMKNLYDKLSFKTWPFGPFGLFLFENLVFLKLLMDKFGLFDFLGPGNSVPKCFFGEEKGGNKFLVPTLGQEVTLLLVGCSPPPS
jgi:hypothetical protein